jgi:hypothetical protein
MVVIVHYREVACEVLAKVDQSKLANFDGREMARKTLRVDAMARKLALSESLKARYQCPRLWGFNPETQDAEVVSGRGNVEDLRQLLLGPINTPSLFTILSFTLGPDCSTVAP